MNRAEYIEQKIKVEKYKILQNKKDNLIEQRNRISSGILGITTAYQKEVKLIDCGEEFEKLLIEIMVDAYDSEISKVEKDISAI